MLEPDINLLPDDLKSSKRFQVPPVPAPEPENNLPIVKKEDLTVAEKDKKSLSGKKDSAKKNFIARFTERFKTVKKTGSKGKGKKTAPDEKQGAFEVELLTQDMLGPKSIRRELIILSGICLAFIVIAAVVFMYYEWRIDKIQTATRIAKEENAQLDIKIARAKKELTRTKQTADLIATIDVALSHRVDWNAIFTRLESLTLKTVYYKNFASGEDGSLELTARAKTAEDAQLQIFVLRNASDFIQSVEISEFSVTEETITVLGEEGGEPVISSFVEFPMTVTLQKD